MLDPLTQVLSEHLRFADVSAVAELARAQMRKNSQWSGFAKGKYLDRMVNTEIIRHCEEAAEFCARATTSARRGEIAGLWYEVFQVQVDLSLAKIGEKCGLTAADLDIVRGAVLAPFFAEDSLLQVLREDSLAIYAADLKQPEEIMAWLASDSPLARFLFGRGREQSTKDRVKRRGYLQRGVEGPIVQCLELLNGVVNDPQPWPEGMLGLVPMREETQQARQVAGSGIWERRRFRRMLLNDLFERALDPRMGYSPRLGTLRWYLENRLLASRVPDQVERYIRQKNRGDDGGAAQRNEYPLLNEDQIEALPGFVRALADPASFVGRLWMEAIARVESAVAEQCRMVWEGHKDVRLTESDLVRCLNAAMTDRPVVSSGAAEAEPGLPAGLKAFLALAPRAYRLVNQGMALYNRRTLEIAFRGWVAEPRPVVWDEEDATEREDEGEDAIPDLLADAYPRAVLDLLLVTRIPPDGMGRATRTGLAWYGAEGGKQVPGILDELVRWFQVEHVDALRALEELDKQGGKDERDREAQAKAVAEGEALLERVGDPTVREVIARLNPKAARRAVGLGGARLHQLLREVAADVEIGHMDQLVKDLKLMKDGRGAMDACGLVEYARATVRLARAESRIQMNVGERKAFEAHDGRWVRSQQDVGIYLGRHQSTIQRALRNKRDGQTLLQLATGFAELRLRGHIFPNEDEDPVGPGRGTSGKSKKQEPINPRNGPIG
jgi:hypothetical protein